MPVLTIMQGLPASGKSTKARELQALDPEHTVIVSRDALRQMRGKYWIPQQETYIGFCTDACINLALEQGFNIIIDEVNFNEVTLAKWHMKACEHGYDVHYERMDAPLAECLKRDNKRERPVGKAVIMDFYNRYKDKYNLV